MDEKEIEKIKTMKILLELSESYQYTDPKFSKELKRAFIDLMRGENK